MKVIGHGWGLDMAPLPELHDPNLTEIALNAANNALAQTQVELQTTMEKNVNLYKAIRVEQRKGQRMTVRKQILEGQIKLLQAVELPAATLCRTALMLILDVKTQWSSTHQMLHAY
jgi:hypothetical protein